MFVPLLAALVLATGASALNYTDNDCSLPKANGGLGFCGPSQCANIPTNTNPSCDFSAACTGTANSGCTSTIVWQTQVSRLTSSCSATCKQSSLSMCTKASLSALIGASSGTIKLAYCTDAYLVILTNKAPSWSANLDDVPNPPGGTLANGSACVTRSSSITPSMATYLIPLNWTLLATDSSSNNIAAFPFGAGDGNGKYLSTSLGTYGIPSGGNVGITITGQEFYPFWNNNGLNDASQCNLDSCQEHVGQGGGQPHLHGDPFDATNAGRCLYGLSNYTGGATGHPPQLGWSLDGPFIYGRYLSDSAPGATTALDNCGGHTHDGYSYHYHTAIRNVTTTSVGGGAGQTGLTFPSGVTFVSSTPGPNNCWRADISKQPGFWSGLTGNASAYTAPCCSMTEYFTGAGITLTGFAASTSSPTTSPTSSPSPASSPGTSPATTASPATATKSPTTSPPTTTTTSPSISPTASSPTTSSPTPASPTASSSSPVTTSSSSSPSPTASPVLSPSPSATAASSPSSSTSSQTIQKVVYTFTMDYAAITANSTKLEAFKSGVVASIAAAAGVSSSLVSLLSVTSGSVVITSQITFPANAFTSDQANQVASNLVSSPSSTFSSSFLTSYGASSSVAASSPTLTSTSSSPALSTGAIVGIAVGGGVALLLVAVLAVVLIRRRAAVSSAVPLENVKAIQPP